jgi:hypothetical protein
VWLACEKAPRLLAAIGLVAAVGCTATTDADRTGGPTSESRDYDAGPHKPPSPPTYEPTFSALYREMIVPRGCVLGLCHAANAGGLNLQSPAVGYTELVDVASESADCGGLAMRLVAPGAPELSLFYLKLFELPPCGETMAPVGGLAPAELDQVKRWIEVGAPE